MDIGQKVKKLMKKYDTSDPFKLSEFLDIATISYPLGKNINGFYLCYKRIKMIFINSSLDENAQILICTHELGHAVLHPNSNIILLENHTFFSKNKFERQANKFLTYLLLNDKVIKQYQDLTIEQISAATGIPVDYIYLVFQE